MSIVIAEAGSNHNGSVSQAIELVHIAKRAGADYCKFQFINPDGLYLPVMLTSDTKEYALSDVYKQRCKEVLSNSQWSEIWNACKEVNIGVTASVFDVRGVELLSELGADFAKIASCDLNNRELHDLVCDNFDRVIISTGMSTLDEVLQVERHLKTSHPSVRVEYLFCTSLYPTALNQVDFHKLSILQNIFGIDRVGYSDHTEDTIAAAVASGMGVKIFEKHFTLSKSLPGFDHSVALEENELKEYVRTLHDINIKGQIEDHRGVDSNTAIRARRGLYAARDIGPGEILQREDILCVRPKATLAPNDIGLIIGKPAINPIKQYQPFGILNAGICEGQSFACEASDYWRREMNDKGMKD
jgi:N,N'-diacetyllegionaminate synthase